MECGNSQQKRKHQFVGVFLLNGWRNSDLTNLKMEISLKNKDVGN